MTQEELARVLPRVQRPARYTGGEVGAVVKTGTDFSFAFCFPDIYDVGMSHLGMTILYYLINERERWRCERVFAPWLDMDKVMREETIPLYALESLEPVKNFDIVGFTLQYEMSYPAVLHMLRLAGIPLLQKDRGEALSPLVIAGGPCCCNPEPLADFFDLFILGEGEEVDLELLDLYESMRAAGASRQAFLTAAAGIEGIYVPSLYEVRYHPDGTVAGVQARDGAPPVITKRIIQNLDTCYYPSQAIVPFIEIVHDRVSSEVLRGCLRGCRFCQAGFLYRPYREKSPACVCAQGMTLCESTGYDELSLISLSTSDHSGIEPILDGLLPWSKEHHVRLSLPSLRADNFSETVAEKISAVRKSGLTFAPEAGTQRLRDVINKNLTEEEILNTCARAFEAGYTQVKLYFMLGLPTETDEDILGIAKLTGKIIHLYYKTPGHAKGKPQVSLSAATFVPKPFTPFEFEPQTEKSEILRRQRLLREAVSPKYSKVSFHDPDISLMEACLARGDRRLGAVLREVEAAGGFLDAWGDLFEAARWYDAFAKAGLEPAFYAGRTRDFEEMMPWDHLDYGIQKSFLARENCRAHEGVTTPPCRERCAGCGAKELWGRECF